MKILKKSGLIAVFVLGMGLLGVGASLCSQAATNRADGGAPPPPPIPVPTTQNVLISDGGAPPPPPIPWSIA